MEDTLRTPFEQLQSETIYLLRESVALFEKPTLLAEGDARSTILASLAERAFEPGNSPLTIVSSENEHPDTDALLSAKAGEHFEVWPLLSKPPGCGAPWSLFPLASWSQRDVDAFGETDHPDDGLRLLRMCTVGEPGSGKSTLIKRLLEDWNLCQTSPPHRHLLTADRRFFVIDPPGQEPCSRGLMAAASASEIALLVVDAKRGLTTTCKQQAFLLALSGVPHLLVVINKMDLVDHSQQQYEEIVDDFQALSSILEVKSLSFLPVCASSGDNISKLSTYMPWYSGSTLRGHLEMITPGSTKNLTDLRLPVQHVMQHDPIVLGGRLASGHLSVGEPVVVLPSGQESSVVRILRGGEEHESALAGDSLTLELADSVQLSKGDILVSPQSLPTRSSELEATILWLGESTQKPETCYTLHHGARLVSCHVSALLARCDPETLRWTEATPLRKGDIARVCLTTAAPLYFDAYTSNRETGSVTLFNPETRELLATGVIRGPALEVPDVTANAERLSSDHVVRDPTLVERERRSQSYGHEAFVLWFTGLSGSGKSAVAKVVEKQLFERGCHTLFLDGDNVRSGLNGDLGFTEEARTENTRRVAELAALAFEQGQIVVCSFISGKASDREFVRSLIPDGHFLECYVNCPIDVCRQRDPKKLYQKADAGELLSFSGVSIPYEEPESPELELPSNREPADRLAQRVLTLLEKRSLL